MAQVFFTPNLQRYLSCPPVSVSAETVKQLLDEILASNPRLARYILDDQRRLRQHVIVFVDGEQVCDRENLSDPIGENSEVYVMQALSGGNRPR